MLKAVLLLFVLVSFCINGCIPSTVDYWDEVRGCVLNPDGTPVADVSIGMSFLDLNIYTKTDENGNFIIGPIRYRCLPSGRPTDDALPHPGGFWEISLSIEKKELGMHYLVLWASHYPLKNKNALYYLDLNRNSDESSSHKITEDGFFLSDSFKKLSVDYSNPPEKIIIKNEKFTLIFFPQFLEQLKKKTSEYDSYILRNRT